MKELRATKKVIDETHEQFFASQKIVIKMQ